MVLIDALYINTGGGKILLDYLIAALEQSGREVFYLLDERVRNRHTPVTSANTVTYRRAGLRSRAAFYRKHRLGFSTVLCLGNLPPEIKPEAKVYTYMQLRLYVETPPVMSWREHLSWRLKRLVMSVLSRNTDIWLVQTSDVARRLARRFHIDTADIEVLPFFVPPVMPSGITRDPHRFIYAGNAPEHKNHLRLIEAFCNCYDSNRKGSLVLTVSPEYAEVLQRIEERQLQGYPIINLGFVSPPELARWVAGSAFAVYPSLSESFGLGIIEAIALGCRIIGADLAYMHEVCVPSLTFDPCDTGDIAAALSVSLQEDLPESIPKVHNGIVELIDLLN